MKTIPIFIGTGHLLVGATISDIIIISVFLAAVVSMMAFFISNRH